MNDIIQRPDMKPYGFTYSIVPQTSKMNYMACFGTEGTKDEPVDSIQTILPDTTNYTVVGPVLYNDQNLTMYKWEETRGYKKNTYKLIVATVFTSSIPVHLHFLGFDWIFGSHYDEYEFFYDEFNLGIEIPEETFNVPEGLKCQDFPGPGSQQHLNTVTNPISELLHDSGEVDNEFEKFKTTHGKSYHDPKEHEARKANFRHNFRFIHSTNRQGRSFKVAVNHLADTNQDERRRMRGYRYTGPNNGLPFTLTEEMVQALPASLDWRLIGAVTPVKDQGICGSCWSFGTAETIEGALFLHKKRTMMVELSQQNLMDCTWQYGNNGCDGGEEWRAYEWIMANGGIATADSYGPYLMADGRCHFKNATVGTKIASYVNVTSGNATALMAALFHYGPVAVDIDASHMTFSFYSSGVYYDPKCMNGIDQLDHSVLAVGYGTLYGEGYWLVKNSWSNHWGDAGYVLMSMKDNNCGVATSPTYVNIE
ncbi:digestive cysteine proteinase 1-like [Corticium candelabrum]|uniref:digestive cysteine proteinase 1-like n=1 Tax=Corticium candelabrum TaxID=121492 RepID=UPI002E268D4A|nr:digestive cysteine proteinase 1-like [Corticium candelabrum]